MPHICPVLADVGVAEFPTRPGFRLPSWSDDPALNVFHGRTGGAVNPTVHIGDTGADTSSGRRHLFPRTAKLLKHPLFDAVYKGGQRHFSGLMTVFFLRRNAPQAASSSEEALSGDASVTRPGQGRASCPRQDTGPRIGFTVGRVLGGSVQRNRIRRRMREAVRLNLAQLKTPVDVVINPKKTVLTAEFPRILDEVQKAFAAIEKNVGREKETRRT